MDLNKLQSLLNSCRDKPTNWILALWWALILAPIKLFFAVLDIFLYILLIFVAVGYVFYLAGARDGYEKSNPTGALPTPKPTPVRKYMDPNEFNFGR